MGHKHKDAGHDYFPQRSVQVENVRDRENCWDPYEGHRSIATQWCWLVLYNHLK